MSRIIMITGKGGVGKSSVAAAHAVTSAAQGVKTLLVSTDMAHNIGDFFQVSAGSHLFALSENLYGLELDPDTIMREEFPDINHSISALFSDMVPSGSKANEMIFPGFDDLFCLLQIKKIYESGEFERIIIDCAPTGETLSLLKLPELLSWYMEKFFPVGKTMVRVLSPISKWAYHVELPSSEGMDDIARLHSELVKLQDLLKNPEISSVRLVCTPEKMVVEETKRSYMYMNLYGYQVDGVFINRILPDDKVSDFFSLWSDKQKKYITELESVFTDVPLTKIPWNPQEIRGIEAAKCLIPEISFDIRPNTRREIYEKTEAGFCLILPAPGAITNEVSVSMHGLDLDVTIGNFRRRIPLPGTLRGSSVVSSEVQDGAIRVCFRLPDQAEQPEIAPIMDYKAIQADTSDREVQA